MAMVMVHNVAVVHHHHHWWQVLLMRVQQQQQQLLLLFMIKAIIMTIIIMTIIMKVIVLVIIVIIVVLISPCLDAPSRTRQKSDHSVHVIFVTTSLSHIMLLTCMVMCLHRFLAIWQQPLLLL